MELWDLYDENRNKTGLTHQRGIPVPEGYYHLVVHVLIQNSQGELLLSKRHPQKHYGNLWECTGGSVLQGETSLDGVLRETKEELGLMLNPAKGKVIQQVMRKNYHSDMWLFQADTQINQLQLQSDEVIDAKWVNEEQYEIMREKKALVPSFNHFFQLIKESK